MEKKRFHLNNSQNGEQELTNLQHLIDESQNIKPVPDWSHEFKNPERLQRVKKRQEEETAEAQERWVSAKEALTKELEGKPKEERRHVLEMKMLESWYSARRGYGEERRSLEQKQKDTIIHLCEEEYLTLLESDPVLCQEAYRDAVRAIIRTELASGATIEDLDSRHGARASHVNDPESRILRMTISAMHKIYGSVVSVQILETVFDKELAGFRGTEMKKEQSVELSSEKNEELTESTVVEKYLSYQDAPVSENEKKRSLDFSRNSPSAQKYAKELVEMVKKYSAPEIEQIAAAMVRECNEILLKIDVHPTGYGESKTWAIWDIGKQHYFFTHHEEADRKYRLADPLISKEKRQEIVDRHVGWEVFAAYNKRGDQKFMKNIPGEKQQKILEYLTRIPKENGTLSSKELAELGTLVRSQPL